MLNAKRGIYKDRGNFVDTGSPHHVVKVESVEEYDVYSEGKRLRNEVYGQEGANVNFVEVLAHNSLFVRTYERGVEDETFSCGTGVTAASLIAFQEKWVSDDLVNIQTKGGNLKVKFSMSDSGFSDVYLIGPALKTFKGIWIS